MKIKLSAFITGILVFTVTGLYAQQQRLSEDARKLLIAHSAISTLYVDPADEKKLTEDAIIGMLEKLDPHSEYSNPEETKELTEPLESNFDGIGIQFNMLTDTLYVIQVISGGPSEKIGLLAGDRIIFVEDTLIAGVKMKNTDIMKRLRGPRNTQVRIKVQRNGFKDLLEYTITRGNIPIYSLDAAYMVDESTGYIRLSRFAITSSREFREAIGKLLLQGMENLVLDLQGNGGGYLHIAYELADEFLDRNKLIVYTQGNRQPRENSLATEKGNFEKGRLVVLVDEYSASASEIVSGAVQDWDRGVIIGRRTFGKGLVQKPIPLPDGSLIRLTVARYYTPSGRNIQKHYTMGNDTLYSRELIARYNRGELMSADSIHFPDSLKFNTLVSKRTVYGGGGIMPDVFVPLDSTRYTDYHRNVSALGLINIVSMNYVDKNRKTLNKSYPDMLRYKRNFDVPETLLQELQQMATEKEVAFNEEQYNKSKPLITLQIKALIARDLFDISEYYQIVNDENESLKEALRIIGNPNVYYKILGENHPPIHAQTAP
ncbi:MAG: S41 family peptidase [Tannerella sp.]|nr:S41 family peptidase [Tannerella sp.]